MFWWWRLIRLVRLMPPMPAPAMLSMSLGGINPRPRTCRGTMAKAAPLAATLLKNLRRDRSFFLFMGCSLCTAGIIALSAVHCDSKIRGVERGFKTRPEDVLSDCIESRSVSGGCSMASRYPPSAIAASGLDRLRYLVEE